MKSLKYFLPLCLFVGAISCKKDKNNNNNNSEPTWISSGNSEVKNYLQTIVKESASATVDGGAGGSITQDGITVNFPAGIFANLDGSAYNGSVNVTLSTVVNSKDMITMRAACVSDSGDLLISGGMFKIDATDNANNKLRVKSGQSYTATIGVANDIKDRVFKGGKRNNAGDQITWDAWPNTGVKRGPNNNSLLLGIDSFTWCNLDRYMSEKPLTEISIKLPAGFTNANSEVFMKYAGTNAAAYIPANPSLQQFSTIGAYYKVVQGRAAKLIAIAKKNGKFYYQIVSISAISANHTETIASMIETTETDFKNQLQNF